MLLEMGRAHFEAQARPHESAIAKLERELERLRKREANVLRMIRTAWRITTRAGPRCNGSEPALPLLRWNFARLAG